jgi:hypothetical protein
LSLELQKRALKFCAKKNWRLTTHDTGAVELSFDELRQFILTEATAAKMEVVDARERVLQEGTLLNPTATISTKDISDSLLSSSTTVEAVAVANSVHVPTTDIIAELTLQFSKLALLIEANMHRDSVPREVLKFNAPSNTSLSSPSTQNRQFNRSGPPPCRWGDNAIIQNRVDSNALNSPKSLQEDLFVSVIRSRVGNTLDV